MSLAEKTTRYAGWNKTVERTLVMPHPGSHYTGSAPERAPEHQPVQPVPFDFSVFDPIKIENALNPILNNGVTLITVLARIRQAAEHQDVRSLHKETVAALKKFDTDCRARGIRKEQGIVSRYILCTALDEAVLMTPWGAESGWAQRSLLALFHQETSGGEKFFILLTKMLERPSENSAVLELMYVCLSLGFQGKYNVLDRGLDKLDQIREQLFQTIVRLRGTPEKALSLRWQPSQNHQRLTRFIPMWVIAASMTATLFLVFCGLRVGLHLYSSPTVAQIEKLSELNLQ